MKQEKIPVFVRLLPDSVKALDALAEAYDGSRARALDALLTRELNRIDQKKDFSKVSEVD